jgi:hypothetical protein
MQQFENSFSFGAGQLTSRAASAMSRAASQTSAAHSHPPKRSEVTMSLLDGRQVTQHL